MTKSDIADLQFKETIRTNSEIGTPMVTCRCGKVIPLRFAFKCYYCLEYLCDSCAAIHFGKTREEYEAIKTKSKEDNNV